MDRTAETSPKQPLRALVLDDDPAAVRAVRCALESRSISVASAGDGDAGLALLLDELLGLDVLLVDLDLPRRDARAFVDLVRRAGGEPDLAIVVLAGEATPQARSELLALGADAVVERAAGGAALAAAALAAVEARAPRDDAPARPLPPARPEPRAEPGRWPSPFGALALVDA